jgi:hypothetical protein
MNTRPTVYVIASRSLSTPFPSGKHTVFFRTASYDSLMTVYITYTVNVTITMIKITYPQKKYNLTCSGARGSRLRFAALQVSFPSIYYGYKNLNTSIPCKPVHCEQKLWDMRASNICSYLNCANSAENNVFCYRSRIVYHTMKHVTNPEVYIVNVDDFFSNGIRLFRIQSNQCSQTNWTPDCPFRPSNHQ